MRAANKTGAIFRKGTNPEIDSCSSFYGNDYFKTTGLADYLKSKQVMQVSLPDLQAVIVFISPLKMLC